MTKEQKLRLEGARWAFETIEKKGMEVAEQELKKRGAFGIPFSRLSTSEVKQFCTEFKREVCCVALLTLADQFDFDREKLILFERRFNLKTDCLLDGETFEEYSQILKDEYDIDIDKVVEW